MIEGSSDSVFSNASAGGHDEHPWLVKSSTTARIGVGCCPGSTLTGADDGDEAVANAAAPAERIVRKRRRTRIAIIPVTKEPHAPMLF